MFNYTKFVQFIFFALVGFFLGVFFSKILNIITMISFYEEYKLFILLSFGLIVWVLVTLLNGILYHRNIDADISIGFNLNPIFLGLVFGIVLSFENLR